MVTIPSKESFGDEEFIPAPELARIADTLVARHSTFSHLSDLPIDFFWKKRAGKRDGNKLYGLTMLVTKGDIMRAYMQEPVEFVIYLGADTCAEDKLTDEQIEAVVYHELLHCGYDEEKERWGLVPHDLIGFVDEIKAYGPWRGSLKAAEYAMGMSHAS